MKQELEIEIWVLKTEKEVENNLLNTNNSEIENYSLKREGTPRL